MALARNVISVVIVAAVLAGLPTVSVGLAYVRRESATLPGLGAVESWKPRSTSVIRAADGTETGRFASEDRVVVPLSGIPPRLAQAFVSAEDRTFWTHKGIDPAAIVRAAVTDIRTRGTKRAVGASTIDQQVIKNLVNGGGATFHRKVREALLAIRLDREVGKPRVLEIYLNAVYLGEGAYGVGAASLAYFGKPVADLDLAGMALLAGLPKGPGNYDPARHPAAALGRRHYVLARMLADSAISAEEMSLADATPLPMPLRSSTGGGATSWFAEEARREVVSRFGAGALYGGGLTVETNEDPSLQKAAEASLRSGLVAYDRRHGWRGPLAHVDASIGAPALRSFPVPDGAGSWRLALVTASALDADVVFSDGTTATLAGTDLGWARQAGGGRAPRTASEILAVGDVVLTDTEDGRASLVQVPQVEGSLVAMESSSGKVLAVVGGFGAGTGGFDRAVQSRRQPGSTFKPFIYLTALEKGFGADSPVLDSPVSIDLGPASGVWEPGSDGDRGMGLLPLGRALELSRNFASVRLLYDLGLPAVENTVKAFGIYPALPNWAAALGALETTDLELTAAYAAMANGGTKVVPSFVQSARDPEGKELWPRDTPSAAPVAPAAALVALRSMLQGVARRGTAARALSALPFDIGGKTGTTNDNRDAWFVGFAGGLAVGVHIGFDLPRSLGAEETGGAAAAPVFGDFVRRAARLRPTLVPAR